MVYQQRPIYLSIIIIIVFTVATPMYGYPPHPRQFDDVTAHNARNNFTGDACQFPDMLPAISLPHWRPTIWLKIVAAIAALIAVYRMILWHVRGIKKYRRSLEQQVIARTRELQLSENRYQSLFETMNSGVAVYAAIDGGQDFVFREFNAAAEQLEGVKREDVLGKRITDVFPSVTSFEAFEAFKRVWKTGQPEYVPPAWYQDERRSGWRENYIYKLPFNEIVAIYNDVTERQEATATIESLARFPRENPNPVIRVLRDGTVMYANQAAQKCLFTETGISERMSVPEKLFPLIAQALTTGETLKLEYQGSLRVFSLTLAPVIETGYVNIYALDITDRKQAEEALAHQRELAESLREVATILNSQLDLERMLPRILNQMKRVIQYDSAGIFWLDDCDLTLLAAYIGDIYDTRNVGNRIPLDAPNPTVRVVHEKRVIILDDIRNEPGWIDWPGTESIHGWMAAPLMVGQQVIGVLTADHYTPGSYTDTDGHILQTFANQAAIAIHNARLFKDLAVAKEHAEVARQAAETANQAKSAFLANMSHELRTPLNAILGFAQIMARNSQIPKEEKDNLAIVRRSGEHLLTLINQVLDLSKIEAGRLALNRSDFDLHRVIRDVEDMFSLKAREKRLIFSCRISPQVPRYIRTDPVRLRQVLINLISNAIKFTDMGSVTVDIFDSGEISDSVDPQIALSHQKAHIVQSISEQAKILTFEVSDTGPGIAKDNLETVFEAFTQIHTDTQAQEGTGLGLTISRKFVHLLGGDITVHSTVGQGSTFLFTIPIDVVNKISVEDFLPYPPQLTFQAPARPYRMLIVDDKTDNRSVLVQFLTRLEPEPGALFQVREAANGREAVNIWQHWHPDMIWMDLRMPVMNGYEASTTIRKLETASLRRDSKTIIIAVTAGARESNKEMTSMVEWDALLQKPFREHDIVALLQTYLNLQLFSDGHTASAPQTPPMYSISDLTPEAFAALPEEWLEQLGRVVETIDVEATLALIDTIDPKIPELAPILRQLVNHYRFDVLQTLFSRKSPSHEHD